MATEKMRLEAEMRDSASPVIAKLRKELTDLQNVSREGRAITKLNAELAALKKEAGGVRVLPGMGAVSGWFKKTGTEAEGFAKAASGASTAFSTLGIGGLAATASIGGLAAAMREMGNRTLAMRELGREIGVSTDYLNAFSHAGQHFGVSSDVMQGALNHLSGQMPEFKRNYGALFQELSRWPDLIKKLQSEGLDDQVKDIFKFLGQAKLQNEPQLQKQILESVFGNGAEMEKLFPNGAQGFLAEIQRQQSKLGTISPELLKAAQDYRDAQIGFTDSLEKFETTAGPAFLSTMSSIVTGAEKVFGMLSASTWSAKEQKDREAAAEDWKLRGSKPEENPFATGKLPLARHPAPPSLSGWKKWLFGDDVSSSQNSASPPWLHKSSYGASGGLLHNASFGGSDTGSDIIAVGTKIGFLAAMREMMATGDNNGKAASGLINASYETGSGGFGAGRGSQQSGAAVARSPFGVNRQPPIKHVGPSNQTSSQPFGIHHGAMRSIPNDGSALIGQGKATRGALTPEGRERVSSWLNFFERPQDSGGMGMPHDKAQAAVAMMQGESSRNLTPNQEVWDVNGPSGGTAQWHDVAGRPGGRLSGLKNFASSLKKDWRDYHVQQQWWRHEALTSHRAAFQAMMHARTPEGSLAAGVAGFEVPQDVAGETRKRLGHLRRLQQDDVAAGHKADDPNGTFSGRRADGLRNPADAWVGRTVPGSQHQLDIRLHDRSGAVQSTSIKSSGHGLHPRLQRWPTAPGMFDA